MVKCFIFDLESLDQWRARVVSKKNWRARVKLHISFHKVLLHGFLLCQRSNITEKMSEGRNNILKLKPALFCVDALFTLFPCVFYVFLYKSKALENTFLRKKLNKKL